MEIGRVRKAMIKNMGRNVIWNWEWERRAIINLIKFIFKLLLDIVQLKNLAINVITLFCIA